MLSTITPANQFPLFHQPQLPEYGECHRQFHKPHLARQELSSPEPTQPKVLLDETMVGCGLGDDEVRKET